MIVLDDKITDRRSQFSFFNRDVVTENRGYGLNLRIVRLNDEFL